VPFYGVGAVIIHERYVTTATHNAAPNESLVMRQARLRASSRELPDLPIVAREGGGFEKRISGVENVRFLFSFFLPFFLLPFIALIDCRLTYESFEDRLITAL